MFIKMICVYIYIDIRRSNKMRDDYGVLEKLSPEKLRQISRYIEEANRAKRASAYPQKVSGGQERLIKLQLRAFERIPGEIIAKYMDEEERQEYEVLLYAYS